MTLTRKDAEIAQIRMALAALDEPVASLSPHEAPDCLAMISNQLVGIEVTGLRPLEDLDGLNVRQMVASQFALVERALQYYQERGGLPISVTFRFRDGVSIPKAELGQSASAIGDAVLAAIQRAGKRLASHHFQSYPLAHPLVAYISVMRVASGSAMMWQPRMAGPVRQVTLADLEITLRGKEIRLDQYRAAARSAWLLVVSDVMGPGLFVDPPALPTDFVLQTGFDRVICASWNCERAVDVPIVHAGLRGDKPKT